MQETSNIDGSWMNDITPKTATLKVRDGEKKRIVFMNNGRKKQSEDYGDSVAFLVRVKGDNEDQTFYVKANNFDLLGQIREIAKANSDTLQGLECEISRTGSKKSDTRYKIVKV